MNIGTAQSWARRCRGTRWLDELDSLARGLRESRNGSGQLWVMGHPDDPPWHFTAHLEMLAHAAGHRDLRPTLADIDGVLSAGPRDTVVSVSEHRLPTPLVDRLDHVRSKGTAILGLSSEDDDDLHQVAREAVRLDPQELTTSDGLFLVDFETASHIFGVHSMNAPRPRLLNAIRRRSS